VVSALAEMTDVFLRVADRVVCFHKLVISAIQTDMSLWRE